MRKYEFAITKKELMELDMEYKNDMTMIETMYHNGEINYQDRGALKRYVWGKKKYIPLWKANKNLAHVV